MLLLQVVFEGAYSPDDFTPQCKVKLHTCLLGKDCWSAVIVIAHDPSLLFALLLCHCTSFAFFSFASPTLP